MSQTTIHLARSIHTMEPANPVGDAMAVRDGMILGVGSRDDLAVWGDAVIDDTFADSVLFPGFVEAHSHHLEGGIWAFEYVGYFDRRGPDGVVRPGCKTVDEVIRRMIDLEAQLDDPEAQLITWGLDPIYLSGERVDRHHLDAVSETRPVLVFHASGHLATVNTALMRSEGFEDIDMEGVPRGTDGVPNGELQEPAAMSLARTAMRTIAGALNSPQAIERLGQIAQRCGNTTVTELGATNLMNPEVFAGWNTRVNEDDYPIRISMFHNGMHRRSTAAEFADEVRSIGEQSTDKLFLGNVKIVLDGSIQGFTARLNPPGYLGDRPNGLWLYTPEAFRELVLACNQARVLLHVHCNGDEAVDMFLDAMAEAQAVAPQPDHRYTVQHCQLTTPAQYRRMAALGLNANIFANHIFYWGDQHHDITVGPERARRMDACATALRESVRFSIHSDASVTPMGHLHTMWCAVNRLTASGRVLGADERISVDQALRAVTVDAAHQLRLDHRIGSLHAGKLADAVALAEDPYEVDPVDLKDIEVRGTMLGGRPQPVS